MDDRRERALFAVASTGLVVALLVSAVAPGRASLVGSSGIAHGRRVREETELDEATGLRVTAQEDGEVFVATGDGGGAGSIEGLDPGAVHVRAIDADTWEIGTEPGRPATRVNANGVRLDDGTSERLRARWFPTPGLVVLSAAVALALRRVGRLPRGRLAASALFLLASALVALGIH